MRAIRGLTGPLLTLSLLVGCAGPVPPSLRVFAHASPKVSGDSLRNIMSPGAWRTATRSISGIANSRESQAWRETSRTVQELKDGGLIRRMNRDAQDAARDAVAKAEEILSPVGFEGRLLQDSSQDLPFDLPGAESGLLGVILPLPQDAIPAMPNNSSRHVAADPCQAVRHPVAEAPEAEWHQAIVEFASCLNTWMEPVRLINKALNYTITYRRAMTERPLSRMADDQLAPFLRSQFLLPGMLAGLSDDKAPRRLDLRDRFEDRDLEEMARLGRKLTERLMVVEAQTFAAVALHRELIEHYADKSNRYRLLLLLEKANSRAMPANVLGGHVAEFLTTEGMHVPEGLSSIPAAMLHPWAVAAVVPDKDHETDPLHEPKENPFVLIQGAIASMAGPIETVYAQQKAYMNARALDNPPMPKHAPPASDAVRIAVVDTGVDFLNYPELGQYLSNGEGGAMASYDFQDDDSNPYLAAKGPGAHGSGTSATVLTILAHYANDLIQDRKLDLAVWKLDSARDLLATPYVGLANWRSRDAMQEALIRESLDESIRVKPKIVSISAIFQIQPYLVNSGKADAVLKAPWLWVMAAGNEGVPVEQDKVPVCLNDVPKNKRVDARILCVGALKRTILSDKITSYSNYGSGVDLYAFESYIDLCPNGTSCSTPAVSGAAAAVAARYPQLTPEEIKTVLLAAAETKELEVDADVDSQGSGQLIHSLLPSGVRFNMLGADTEGPILGGFPWMQNAQGLWSGSGAAGAGTAARGAKRVAMPHRRTVRVLDPSTMMDRIMQMAKGVASMHGRH